MHEVVRQILSYLRGMWQYRWYGVAMSWLVCVVGWVVVFLMPNQYEATARVHVDTQSVLKPLLSGLAVQPNVDQQIAMMSRTLISRPNLERVIRMSDLDIKLKTNEERERLIDGLKKQIKLAGTGRDNLYTITYAATKPEEAKRVVQSLLTIFVEGSLGDKRKDADSAKRFIDEQIKLYEQKLVVAENALKEFKRQNIGMMPSQGRDFISKLQESQNRLAQARLELREAENSRDAFKKQVTAVREGIQEPDLLADRVISGGSSEVELRASPELEKRIEALKLKLDALQLSYTERHPDVIATKRVIEQLEAQKKADIAKLRKEIEARQATAQAQPAVRSVRGSGSNPVLQQLTVSLAEAEAAVAALRTRAAELEQQHNELKKGAHAVPQVEADLVQLNRDYEVNKRNFETLLARRESAQISGEMESNAGVMDFRIIDPPRVPPTPVAPKRPLLMWLVLAVGAGAGVALSFLMSQVRPVFNDRGTLQDFANLPILGTVGMRWTENDVKRQRRGIVALAASVASLFGSFGVAMALLSLTGRA
ncbi:MAG: chain length-determining protein [Burkholderiales bacterium]|nr:chain length-determining protein [Burkholderiales bacterium]